MHILKIHKLITSNNPADEAIGIELFLRKNKYWYILLDILGSILLTPTLVPWVFVIVLFLEKWKKSKGFSIFSYKEMLLVTRYEEINLESKEPTHIFISPFTFVVGMIRIYISTRK